MSRALIDALKVKPKPKKKETVNIVIPVAHAQEDVAVHAALIDKRGEKRVNRTELLARLKGHREAIPSSIKPTRPSHVSPHVPPSKKPKRKVKN